MGELGLLIHWNLTGYTRDKRLLPEGIAQAEGMLIKLTPADICQTTDGFVGNYAIF